MVQTITKGAKALVAEANANVKLPHNVSSAATYIIKALFDIPGNSS